MSTGNLKNHGTKLQSLLRTTKYPSDINFSSLFYGYPQEYLPLLHFLFQSYSLSFSKYLLKRGFEMSGKTDKQFIDVVYKVLRDEFEYIPRLSKDKFFSNGFTEQKLILTCTAYQFVIDKVKSSRKQRPKSVSNKENVHPNKTREVYKSKPEFVEITSDPVTTEQALPLSDYSPMRKPPQPITSQNYDLSDVIEESIIEAPVEYSQTALPDCIEEGDSGAPPTKTYSEEGARDVFALDHLTASEVDIVDSTPQTVLNTVQLVPLPRTCETVRVNVTRECAATSGAGSQSGESEATVASVVANEAGSAACSTPCCHAADIAQIKQLLVTVNARLDILECKAKHSGNLNYPAVPDSFHADAARPATPPTYSFVNTAPPIPTSSRDTTNRSLDKLSDIPEPITCGVVSSPSSAVSNSVDDNEDDIKDFLKSVREKLNDTRSFLRTYDTSQL